MIKSSMNIESPSIDQTDKVLQISKEEIKRTVSDSIGEYIGKIDLAEDRACRACCGHRLLSEGRRGAVANQLNVQPTPGWRKMPTLSNSRIYYLRGFHVPCYINKQNIQNIVVENNPHKALTPSTSTIWCNVTDFEVNSVVYSFFQMKVTSQLPQLL